MVMFKLSPFKTSLSPLKSIGRSSKKSVGKQFKHVTCTDDELSMYYFRDIVAARNAMLELGNRSWEYQFEFAAEMSKRCKAVMGDDPSMHAAYGFYENWLKLHPHAMSRDFPLVTDTLMISNLFSRAQRLVIDEEAIRFALEYCMASSHKKPFHRVLVDKSNPFGYDLLSQRQKVLERIVPYSIDHEMLWDWEFDTDGRSVRVPSRVHLEWLCWGYTPDSYGIWECGNREFGERLNAVL